MKSTNNLLKFGLFAGSMLYAVNSMAKKMRTISFKNKVVLITGGARGLGLVMARQLANEGAKLAICSRHSQQLEDAKLDLERRGAKEVYTITCDVKLQDDVNKMIKEVENYYGQIDILINNAGVITVGSFENSTKEDFQELMDTTFWGSLYTIQAVLPGMKERGMGRIVNISSIGGKIGVPHMLPYSSAKFALSGLSQGLRAELRKDNILVTTVFPGLMRTGSHLNAEFKGDTEKEYKWFSESDLNPLLSESAESSAKQIIDGIRYGNAEVSFPMNNILATRLYSLFPNISADFMTLFDMILPKDSGKVKLKGYQTETELRPKILEKIGNEVAVKNNEL